MPDCHDMKEGEIYYCDCGLELKVIKTCTTCSEDSDSCGCSDDAEHGHKHGGCTFTCCGKPLSLKK